MFNGPEKYVSLSESLTYPGSHLNEVFWCNLIRKFKVPVNSVPVSESPTYPGSHLTRVYCNISSINYAKNVKISMDRIVLDAALILSLQLLAHCMYFRE